jgi:hypothetical protein
VLVTSAAFTRPLDGTVGYDVQLPVTWTSVSGAQAYYLYVGSSPGLNDLVNTGEIQTTSYTLPSSLGGRTLYLRLYTKFGGVWRYVDATITTAAGPAAFIRPVNGTVGYNLQLPVMWTPVTGAQAYYLYVGSSPGLNDLVNTGEIQTTSYTLPSSLGGRTLYLRLYTKLGGVWKYVDAVVTTQ